MLTRHQDSLSRFLCRKANAESVQIHECRQLSGGAIQENWLLDMTFDSGPYQGRQALVLRADAPSRVGDSHSRAQEFSLLKAAFAAGVTVPEPLWLGEPEVLGRDFFVMRKAEGSAAGYKLVRDATLGGDKEKLVERIGAEMAKLHRIRPPRDDLSFLSLTSRDPTLQTLDTMRTFLDQHHTPFPALEYGLNWLEDHAPPCAQRVLVHRDFRTGNYMVDNKGLTAILDWEFASFAHPMEDLGWFCARCWRFGQSDISKEAGGIGSRAALYRGYEQQSGSRVDDAAVRYFEVFAHMRWAIIAIKQGERHVSGTEPSLELALTAHIVPELELEILRATRTARFTGEEKSHA